MTAVSSAALAEQVRAALEAFKGFGPPRSRDEDRSARSEALAALDRLVAELDSERQALVLLRGEQIKTVSESARRTKKHQAESIERFSAKRKWERFTSAYLSLGGLFLMLVGAVWVIAKLPL